jgi:hypothetical protein
VQQDVDVVALVGQNSGDVADVVVPAVAEEPGVVGAAREVGAGGELVGGGGAAFGVDEEPASALAVEPGAGT